MSMSTLPPLAPLPGRLLVATPALEDPNFHRSVVLILAFDPEDGTLGVVLNRPNDVPVGELLPEWEPVVCPPVSVFVGGPVRRSNIIGVARMRSAGGHGGFDGCNPIAGPLATVDLNRDPETVARGIDGLRLFSGYAGWEAGQLEDELAGSSWFVLKSDVDDAFTDSPEDLWTRVLRREGGRYNLYANAPPNLSLN